MTFKQHIHYKEIFQKLTRCPLIFSFFASLSFLLFHKRVMYRKNGNANINPTIRTDSEHNLQEYTYKKITPCDVCSQVLRGKCVCFSFIFFLSPLLHITHQQLKIVFVFLSDSLIIFQTNAIIFFVFVKYVHIQRILMDGLMKK